MKRFTMLLVALAASSAFAGDVWVNGYTRNDGTYVQGHHRSAPDGNPYNNYSTQGNVNPYTGQAGTVDPYKHPSYEQPSRSSYQAPVYQQPAHQQPQQIQPPAQYGQPGYCNPYYQRC